MDKKYIEQRNGGYYVAGVRVSLDSIVHAFLRGESPETIAQNFPALSLEQVYGAITYYLGNKAAVDEYLKAQDQKWAEMQAQSEPLPPEMLRRLQEAWRARGNL